LTGKSVGNCKVVTDFPSASTSRPHSEPSVRLKLRVVHCKDNLWKKRRSEIPPTLAMPHSYVVTGLPSGATAETSWPWPGSTTWPDRSCRKIGHLLRAAGLWDPDCQIYSVHVRTRKFRNPAKTKRYVVPAPRANSKTQGGTRSDSDSICHRHHSVFSGFQTV
jgi:hypothetical protein